MGYIKFICIPAFLILGLGRVYAAPATEPWVEASSSCLPAFTALQTTAHVSSLLPQAQMFALVTQLNGALVASKVQLRLNNTSDPTSVSLSVLFDPFFQGVSLPYNLFAVMILREGEVVAWWDYTNSCQGPGLGFYPGHEIHLPALKIPQGKSQTFQIMVWGRL